MRSLLQFKFSFLILSLIVVLSLTVQSCDETYTPKPKGFFRIDLPQKVYGTYDDPKCPWSFELPGYSKVMSYNDSIAEPCWKYIRFTQFNAEVFLSYKRINNDVVNFIEDARTLAYKHTVKADVIDETLIETPNQVYGRIYDIGGSAASSVQFYATDSTTHFLRGALYFNHPPQPDSLAPVIQFLREDIIRMISTINWK